MAKTTTLKTYAIGDIIDLEYAGRGTGVVDADGKLLFWKDKTAPIASTGGPCIICKITGGTSAEYTVDLYANGKSEASTGSGFLQVTNMHINETLAVGTCVVGHPAIVTSTPGD